MKQIKTSSKEIKKFCTKMKVGEIIKSSGPMAMQIKHINSHGQIEFIFIMEPSVYMEKPRD